MVNSFNNNGPVERKFPRELLTANGQDRLEYFSRKNLIVSHPNLRGSLKRIKSAVDPGLDQNTILFVGPSGVGKTAILNLLVKHINQSVLAGNPTDRTSIPAIGVEADAPERGNFDWRYIYVELLEALNAPLVAATLPTVERRAGSALIETVAPERAGGSASISSLRHRVRMNLFQRQVQLLTIDEAANLLKSKSYRNDTDRLQKIKANADTVRSLINHSSATLVLAGALDLFDMVNLSGQLARRCQIVYFPEYSDSENDIQGFTEGFLGLLSHLPGNWEADVPTITSLVFEQSLGCIGIARTILHRWLKSSIEEAVPMNEESLKKSIFPAASLNKLREELRTGRMRVEDLLAADSKLSGSGVDDPAKTKSSGNKSASKTRVGQTAPSRRWAGEYPEA